MLGISHRSGRGRGIALAIFGLALNAAVAESQRPAAVFVNHGTVIIDPEGFTADRLMQRGSPVRSGPMTGFSGTLLRNDLGGTIYGHGSLDAAQIETLGVMEFNGPSNVTGAVSNHGTIRITERSAALFLGPLVHNGASIDIEAGGRTVFFGRVSGGGHYAGEGEVVFAGTFAPGNSPALISFAGDVTFSASSTLEIEIGGLQRGTEYDALDVGRTAALDGTLDVMLIDGFVPVAGDSFDIIVADAVVGQFATVQAPALSPGLFWVVDYDLDAGGNDTVRLLIDVDDDGNTVPNTQDNCTQMENASQCDSDADGYGNHCDGDFNNNTFTNAQDYILFRQQLGQPSVAPAYNQADLNCNDFVNAQDYVLFRNLLGQPSGPSGLVP